MDADPVKQSWKLIGAGPGSVSPAWKKPCWRSGSKEANKRLGLGRANRVVNYLISQGISADRLEAVASFGETQPLIVTEGRERRNRRTVTDVIGYANRHGVQLIALTGSSDSSLARAANVALVLPKVREACPHNLAPTTSTLLQLAMGDALAIALLQRRGFSEESFHSFHPGGSLGAALKRVDEIMLGGDELPLVANDASVMAALNILSAKGQGIVGVTDKSKLVGVVTDGDIRRYLERNSQSTMQEALHETATSEMMTVGSVTLTPNMLVGETLRVMQTKRISAAFVLDDENPVGLITMLRLLNRGAA